MAKYYINLFKNKNPKALPSHPGFVCMWDKETKQVIKPKIGEIEYTVACWVKKTKAGDDYLSIQLSDEVYQKPVNTTNLTNSQKIDTEAKPTGYDEELGF